MPTPWLIILCLVGGALGGALILGLLIRSKWKQERAHLQEAGDRIRRDAELEGEKARFRKEQELNQKEVELQSRETVVQRKESSLEKEALRLERQQQTLQSREEAIESLRHEVEKHRRLYRQRLHSMQEWDEERAREAVFKEVRKECEQEIHQLRSSVLGKTEEEIEDEARRLLLSTMQRISSNPANETSATMVKLKSEDMKGRIIGREGRNIRSFESTTGTTLMIDETPDSVLISSFDPVRREIARMALEALMKDGRINPATIEETVQRCESDMVKSIQEWGEKSLRTLRLNSVTPEIIQLLGKLHYRLSNNQNTLDHSIEVAYINSLLAAELGLDQTLAKRAGLFHDMGKSVGHEYEGSHASVAADILKRNGEDPRVVNAVAAHHEEVPDESVYAPLLKVADTLSAMRPGARTDSMESYIRRIKNLEEVAAELEGVEEAYAIQAGREVRVVVSPDKVDDEQARKLALSLRQKVEEELNFPGTIKITVIREQRFQETAK